MKKLSDLVIMDDPEEVLGEVFLILHRFDPAFDVSNIGHVFNMVWQLYCGRYPGYRACNTGFHDFFHTTDVLIAHARLIHGAVLGGVCFSNREITLALIAALLHDVGYIQDYCDEEGRGGKYTLTHVSRGCEFTRQYATELRLTQDEVGTIQSMLRHTDLAVPLSELTGPTPACSLLGRLLGAADLYGQMADRCYLEKLSFLYEEFMDGNIDLFKSVEDLMEKTSAFYATMSERLEWMEPRGSEYYRLHFLDRWGIDRDLYATAIGRHKAYLQQILEKDHHTPQRFLRRHVKLPSGLDSDSEQCDCATDVSPSASE